MRILDEIRALPITQLNLAIEEQCYGRLWEVVTCLETAHPVRHMYEPAGIWIQRDAPRTPYDGPWGIGKMPYDYTEDWNACMPLALRHGITISWQGTRHPEWALTASRGSCRQEIEIDNESAMRLAICQLALWTALQQRKIPE